MTNEKLKAELAVFGTVEVCELVPGFYGTGQYNIKIRNYDFRKKGHYPTDVLQKIYEYCECWKIITNQRETTNGIFEVALVSKAYLYMANSKAWTEGLEGEEKKDEAFSRKALKYYSESLV